MQVNEKNGMEILRILVFSKIKFSNNMRYLFTPRKKMFIFLYLYNIEYLRYKNFK